MNIIPIVQYYFNAPDLLAKNRRQPNAFHRQICMYLHRTETNLTQQRIAKLCNVDNHSTVLHAERLIPDLMKYDKILTEDICKLREMIRKQAFLYVKWHHIELKKAKVKHPIFVRDLNNRNEKVLLDYDDAKRFFGPDLKHQLSKNIASGFTFRGKYLLYNNATRPLNNRVKPTVRCSAWRFNEGFIIKTR